jgi:hypothetical protein
VTEILADYYQPMKQLFLIPFLVLSSGPAYAERATALDMSEFSGTISVEFHPMQAAGVLGGCTLVYKLAQQDFVYRNGTLISIGGNIAYFTNRNQDMIGLSLKIGTVDSLSKTAKPEAPFYAYIQTPHGTTAKSKMLSTASDTEGAKIFVYDFDEGSMAVLKDILDGQLITIGFNRHKDGMDVLSNLDLHVADSTVASDGSIKRHRTDAALEKFAICAHDLTTQVQKHNK